MSSVKVKVKYHCPICRCYQGISVSHLQLTVLLLFKPLPDDKILAFSKLKAITDDNFDMAQTLQFLSSPLGVSKT